MDNIVQSINKIVDSYTVCKKCKIGKFARNKVHFRGNLDHPKFLFIGEAPGKQEDREGIPFVGQSGKILNNFIKVCKIKDYCIINTVACRPTDCVSGPNRQPSLTEIENCKERTISLIKEINAENIITLGKVAENWFVNNFTKRFLAIYHPAYWLRMGGEKSEVFEGDVRKFKKFIKRREKDAIRNKKARLY